MYRVHRHLTRHARPAARKKRPPERPRPRGAKDTLLFRERLEGAQAAATRPETPGGQRRPEGCHAGAAPATCVYSKRPAWASVPAAGASRSAGTRRLRRRSPMQTRPRGTCVAYRVRPDRPAGVTCKSCGRENRIFAPMGQGRFAAKFFTAHPQIRYGCGGRPHRP